MINIAIETIFSFDSALEAIQYIAPEYYEGLSDDRKDCLQGEDDYSDVKYMVVNQDTVIISNPDAFQADGPYTAKQFVNMTEQWFQLMEEEGVI